MFILFVISSITFMLVWFIINITVNNFGEKDQIVQCLSSLVDIDIECSHRYNVSYAFLHIISNKPFHASSVFHTLGILSFILFNHGNWYIVFYHVSPGLAVHFSYFRF